MNGGTSWRRALGGLGALLLAGWLGACDVGYGPLGSASGGERLRSGAYRYRAWSDYGGAGPAWSGYVDLTVGLDGVVRGTYRLPWQCSDAFGYEADCYGRVGGRVYRDGTVRFGFDEGWLGHSGSVRPGSWVRGYWDTRVLGYRDAGTFELAPY